MLDTYGRKYFQKFIEVGANLGIKFGFSANNITIFALFLGVISGVINYFYSPFLSVIILWLSGYFDAVDGTIARKTKSSSDFGTVMDITFDRIVEGSIIISMALKYSSLAVSLVILTVCIVLSMTVFLTTGMLAEKKGEKTFYYQAGLAERTEGFIMLSLIMLMGEKSLIIINLFIIMILITIIQRFLEAKKILK